jgi:acyl carrier protein
VRNAVAEHDPARDRALFALPGESDVHRFVVAEANRVVAAENGHRAGGSVVAQNSPAAPRRILGAAQREETERAEQSPGSVETCEATIAGSHGWYHTGPMTRGEIEEKLIAIVRGEKNIAEDQFTPAMELAAAGIDSLDALTILFAIEEQFHISIPDDRARAMRTFGDMIETVEQLLATS